MQTGRLLLLGWCVVGIYASYLTQGIVNEELALKKYGEQQERFKNLEALNGAQALTCWLWAWLILLGLSQTGQISNKDLPPWTAYWRVGVTNTLGPSCGMIALKNITYSAQVLAKSCKMVPVMIMGTLMHGLTYTSLEYVCMSLIGIGVALFGRKSSNAVTSKLASPNPGLGYTLCMVNLAFDGYTNAVQDGINKQHPCNSPIHMMCWTNFWTAFYYTLYMFVASSTGMDLVAFCSRHPECLWDIVLFCVCGAVGQLFIFFTIKTFGSLANTLICTTRKFFNILISVVWNQNPLLPIQWLAVVMVFTGLLTSTLSKSHGKPTPKTTKKKHAD